MARLGNLDRLYLVPVLAVRSMLAQKLENDETRLAEIRRLPQEQLIAEVDRTRIVSEEDIDHLYDSFRYGRRLSLQLFLLPDDFVSVADDSAIEQAIADLIEGEAVTDKPANLGEEDDDDFSWDEVGGQVIISDHVRFGDVLEIRFRYLILHRFLNEYEEPAHVFETRYGYVWISPGQRYLALLAKDGVVAKKMLESVSIAMKVIPKPVQFPKDLIDQHFDIDNAKRLSHLDPKTGVRQSISGEKEALSGFMGEIEDRDSRYMRPGALYEEEIDESTRSGLGITAKKGRIYFTRTLSTTQVHLWVDTRLRSFVGDIHRVLAERPENVYQASIIVSRLRTLDGSGKRNLELLLDAVVHARKNEQQTVQLGIEADAIYEALGHSWLQRYYVFSCPDCNEACGLCPKCDSAQITQNDQELTCAKCGCTLSSDGMATLCCVDHHTHSFDIADSLGYLPTRKLLRHIHKLMMQLDLSWNLDRDTIHIDAGGLHHLSAPPDSTIVNHYGDHIEAKVGNNATNVTIGKGIQVNGGG